MSHAHNSNILIAPSLLAADFACLREEIAKVTAGGAQWLHLDVMDGHFVPNITMGPCVVKAIRPVTDLVLDVHLMISEPARYVDTFIEAGADVISFHLEAVEQPLTLLQHIKAAGCQAGLTINPDTAAERLLPWLEQLDLVLLMSVFPGFGGQKFIPTVLGKVGVLRQARPDLAIAMDGGINRETLAQVVAAGVNIIVAGSAILGAADPTAAVRFFLDKALSLRKGDS